MKQEFLPTKVFVCFYDRSSDWRGKLIKWLSLTKTHHCGIMLERDNKVVLLASDKTHKAKFVDACRFHGVLYHPFAVIELGISDVSLRQLNNLISMPYIGDARSMVFWYFFGRKIFPKLIPASCSLITCYMLRLCGFMVKDHVMPKDLYKELTCATNNDIWTSRSWEDYLSDLTSRRGVCLRDDTEDGVLRWTLKSNG